jgi:hypothetical protein
VACAIDVAHESVERRAAYLADVTIGLIFRFASQRSQGRGKGSLRLARIVHETGAAPMVGAA